MGHIRKLRFAGILGLGLLATAGTGVAMAQGGLSANLALSNTFFTQQVGGIDGTGFALFVDSDEMTDGPVGVSRLRIDDAKISDLCMSAPVKVPGMGDRKFQMVTEGDNTQADNLVIGSTAIEGTLTLVKPQIGVDTGQLGGPAGSGGIAAEKLLAKDQTIHASSIAADQLTAAGAKIIIEEANGGRC